MTGRDVFGTRLRPGGLAGAVRREHAGTTATLAGWVHRVRNLGGIIFVDLRDRGGIVQVSFNPDWTSPEVIAEAATLGQEYVISVEGAIGLRPEEMRNP
ncbi:MAG TPA: OB-fold nucleic acid binding domain-containing protein, partial [Gemmatimonadaceae bacterium]|nr:OB-fold nucleic acid binding domain-containing protein [Gemmatimonadaceae bacterium]